MQIMSYANGHRTFFFFFPYSVICFKFLKFVFYIVAVYNHFENLNCAWPLISKKRLINGPQVYSLRNWILLRLVANTLFGWWNWPGKHVSSIWNLAPLCLMLCLLRERNRRTFEDMESSDDQLLTSFSGSLFDWSRAWGLTSSDSLPLFLSSLLYN